MVRLPPPLDRIRPCLEREFGARLRGVVLFGSRARGDHRPDSDVDLLVLLEPPFSLAEDQDRTIHALYPLQLESDVLLHPLPVDSEDFESQRLALYREVRRDGVRL
ncbi:MAG: nucleotidyltransferase domain-containing protein [Planctomycetes bacterium]|nr:nucleotidyltransferase domain-containing protein [Planctomycetota bacterium]